MVYVQDVRVYVRPCSLNEFLSTKSEGECVACCAGSYNFNTTAVRPSSATACGATCATGRYHWSWDALAHKSP